MAKRINIPNVTGNIVITVMASELSPSLVNNMTYGKGIDMANKEIIDNSNCWATVNSVTVEQGETYEISCDATWLWVFSFDESGNYVSDLINGSDVNPQEYRFTANTTKIKYGCYDPTHELSYCTLTKLSVSSYSIIKYLNNCTISNPSTTITKGESFNASIVANEGYTLSSITVTMGGNDITFTAVNGNDISISNVKGDISISAIAILNNNEEEPETHPNITQTSVVGNLENSAAYSTYKTFFNNSESNIIIPGLTSVMIPQGICKSGDYLYVSAHDRDKANYSCIYVIKFSTGILEKTVWLENNYNHVGGLGTDGTYLYVTCGSTIGITTLSTINNASNNADIKLTYVTPKNYSNNTFSCSFCSYDTVRNLLWVGTYNETSTDYAYAYKTNGTGELTLKGKMQVPIKTQGLDFIDSYVYFSTSYSRNNTSNIYKCSISNSGTNYTYSTLSTITAPPLSQDILIYNNNLYIVFESAAKYFLGSDDPSRYPVDRICSYKLTVSSGLKDFPYANELVEIAKTYWRNADNEYVEGQSWSQGTMYRASNTPLSADCEASMDVDNSFWVAVGGRHYKAIDCSTLVGIALRGYTYENGPYANKTQFDQFRTNRNQTNSSVSWAFLVPRTAAEIGEYCVNKNWIVPLNSIGNSSNNFSGLKKGDLIFWAKKNTDGTYREPDRFMKISHVAIVYGNSDTYSGRLSVIESTSTTTKVHTLSDGSTVNCGVRIKDIANNKADEIVLVARIQV